MKRSEARDEAISKGLKRYNSNTQCKRCGTVEKYVADHRCVFCAIKTGTKKLNNPTIMSPYRTKEKRKQSLKNWRLKNPEKVALQNLRRREKNKEWYQHNKDKCRDSWLVKKYGMTLNEYITMLKKQKFKCKICGTKQCSTGKQLAVDHCHITQKIRGLLCFQCNSAIGQLKHNIVLLEKAIEYLRSM